MRFLLYEFFSNFENMYVLFQGASNHCLFIFVFLAELLSLALNLRPYLAQAAINWSFDPYFGVA